MGARVGAEYKDRLVRLLVVEQLVAELGQGLLADVVPGWLCCKLSVEPLLDHWETVALKPRRKGAVHRFENG